MIVFTVGFIIVRPDLATHGRASTFHRTHETCSRRGVGMQSTSVDIVIKLEGRNGIVVAEGGSGNIDGLIVGAGGTGIGVM